MVERSMFAFTKNWKLKVTLIENFCRIWRLTITYWCSERRLGVRMSSAGLFHSWWQYLKFILVVWQNLGQWVRSICRWKINSCVLCLLQRWNTYWLPMITLPCYDYFIRNSFTRLSFLLQWKSTNCSLLN